MDRTLKTWQFVGFAVTSFLGTVFHFLFDLSGQNPVVAAVAATNESTFEHMKLLFFPMLFFALIESRFIGGEYGNFWCVKLKGTLLGLLLIPVLFYTYNGVFGRSPAVVDIAIFFVSAALACLLEARALQKGDTCRTPRLAIGSLFLLALFFVVFTFAPPHIPLFLDPVTKKYGI